ncbi:MAG: hypothetical protein ACYTGV_02475 [Planctomycetota bacterium]|jgi:hypothetical protein
MRAHRLAIALLAVFSSPALALEIVEMKDGKTYAAESVRVAGERLQIQLHTKSSTTRARFSVPISRVVPEVVYYAWRDQIRKDDAEGHLKLAVWSRKNGIFSLAMKQYEAAAALDQDVRASLSKVAGEMHEEEATWLFEDAERLYQDNEVKAAQLRVDLILKEFADTKEVPRAKALGTMIADRAQFLTDKRRKREEATRARKHRLLMDKQVYRIQAADRLVYGARMRHWVDALGRFKTAAYTYRSALMHFEELQLTVDADALRKTLRNLIEDVQVRMVKTFTKLADLRYMTGDIVRAMDAVHEIMAVDPGNEHAADLRDRILESSEVERIVPGGFWGVGGFHGGPRGFGSIGIRRRHYNPKPYPTPTDPFRRHRRWSSVRRYYR